MDELRCNPENIPMHRRTFVRSLGSEVRGNHQKFLHANPANCEYLLVFRNADRPMMVIDSKEAGWTEQ